MSDINWKRVIGSVAPALATALGGPLAGTAAKVLGDALLRSGEAANEAAIEAIVNAGLTPDQIAVIKKADADFVIRMRELDIEIDKLKLDEQRVYVDDTKHAREKQASVDRLGYLVVATFAVIATAILWGCYELLTGGIVVKDIGVVASVMGLIGTLIGYVAANAQQVLNYRYGSTQGSSVRNQAMADSVKALASK